MSISRDDIRTFTSERETGFLRAASEERRIHEDISRKITVYWLFFRTLLYIRTYGRTKGRTKGRSDGRTVPLIFRYLNATCDGRTDGRTDRRTVRSLYALLQRHKKA
ncbi:hypothetical protein DPMN_068609 [Dreissena polymorpha]|uniref:Uncharacterized protein n=1 Tax=Dreissena polymorpha TaxID=45954 RepID=A0A9D3YXG4_DREPO|nr:hypothetical protein DPMN_068609 [Dreissena polymorpha]